MDDGFALAPILASENPIIEGAGTRVSGYLDGVHGRCVEGWIFDPATPDDLISVDIFDGDRLLGSAPARLFRPDLAASGIGDGNHGFRFPLPLEIFDGREHEISVCLQNGRMLLPGSPYRLATGSVPGAGVFELDPIDFVRPGVRRFLRPPQLSRRLVLLRVDCHPGGASEHPRDIGCRRSFRQRSGTRARNRGLLPSG